LDQKDQEWREILKEKDRKLNSLEKEKDEAYKQISHLKDALKNAEGSFHYYLNYWFGVH